MSISPEYSGVEEVSIYVHPSTSGKGIGNSLFKSLINESENQGFWTMEAKFLVKIRQAFNCIKRMNSNVVVREGIEKNGIQFGNILLERRSSFIGINKT